MAQTTSTQPETSTSAQMQLSISARDALVHRLATTSGLALPAHVQRAQAGRPVTELTRQAYLRDLIVKDPSIFLERHGSELTDEELDYFEPLHGDYEVNHFLAALRSKRAPSTSTVKNRYYPCVDVCTNSLTYLPTCRLHQSCCRLLESMHAEPSSGLHAYSPESSSGLHAYSPESSSARLCPQHVQMLSIVCDSIVPSRAIHAWSG